MKNLKINKRLASLLLAMGISLCSHTTLADIISYNNKTTLKNGKEANLYFITGDTVNDYAYISFDNVVGYISVNDINIPDEINNEYVEIQKDLIINSDIANVYSVPDMSLEPINAFHQNDQVHVVAKSNNGWYIVSSNNITGFLHESAFKLENNVIKTIKVTGNKVNVRLSPNVDTKDNIIGSVNNGEKFSLINHETGWYLIDYFGQSAYISDSYAMEIMNDDAVVDEIRVAKIVGCNVNIRSSSSTESDYNIIGFADITDNFRIIDQVGNWYIIDYLGQNGYVNSKYVEEKMLPEENIKTEKMVYLKYDSAFYFDSNGTYMTTLPEYQYVSVIKEENGYYKVRVDGVIGYVKMSDTRRLTNTFIIVDLGRQIVKVFKNNREVHRCHMISGRKSMQTEIGCFKIGHRLRDYQLTPELVVKYWMQYNYNIGLHDHSRKSHKDFMEVARRAYDAFERGKAKTYADYKPSHGCNNLEEADAAIIYDISNVGDNVLVIGPNSLINDHLIGSVKNSEFMIASYDDKEKIKKLV